jgi:hypothetical protein
MDRMRKAIVCDAIITKFRGNKSFNWDEIHSEEFFKIIDGDYFVVENQLNFLLGEDLLEKYTIKEEYGIHSYLHDREYIRLTPKGFATLGDIENMGYVGKEKEYQGKKRLDKLTLYGVYGGIVVSIIISVVPIMFAKKTSTQKQSSMTVKVDTTHKDTIQFKQKK